MMQKPVLAWRVFNANPAVVGKCGEGGGGDGGGGGGPGVKTIRKGQEYRQ